MARTTTTTTTSSSKPAPAAQPAPAPAPVVALRGGIAVASVTLGSKPYHSRAPHNVAWWQAVTAAITAGSGTASVAPLVQPAPQGAGVPAHFIAYGLRRGYLAQPASA